MLDGIPLSMVFFVNLNTSNARPMKKTLLDKYSTLTLDNVREHQLTYLTYNKIAVQDEIIIHDFPMNNILKEGN